MVVEREKERHTAENIETLDRAGLGGHWPEPGEAAHSGVSAGAGAGAEERRWTCVAVSGAGVPRRKRGRGGRCAAAPSVLTFGTEGQKRLLLFVRNHSVSNVNSV